MNVLFVMPEERGVYARSNVQVDFIHLPSLAFASLGAVVRKHRGSPCVLDLSLVDNAEQSLQEYLEVLRPQWVGFSCTTPTYNQTVDLARLVRRSRPEAKVIVGGAHVSFLPEEALEAGCFDYVAIGEAEGTLARLLSGEDPGRVPGIALRTPEGAFHSTPAEPLVDLEALPFPDYGLYSLERYTLSPFYVRENPAVWIETGRGCPFRCKYCSKGVHGSRLRNKSPDRVVAELRHLVSQGVREFFLADNGFTDDQRRAERICDSLIASGPKCHWDCVNGLRVDCVTESLLQKMRRAGCRQISFGLESGNQSILDRNGKGISLKAAEQAVRWASRAGIDVWGFFLLGFPEETEETLRDTLAFAKRLPLDLAKANMIIPYPDSPLYAEYKAAGLLSPRLDYSEFNSNTSPRQIYRHPTLPWECLERYQQKFYTEVYFHPRFLARRALHSLQRGRLTHDLRSLIRWRKGQQAPGYRLQAAAAEEVNRHGAKTPRLSCE